MAKRTDPLNALEQYLSDVRPGPIADAFEVEQLLARAWHRLEGSSEERMHPRKLAGRTEDLEWRPPELTFVIERHGGTMMGSTRAVKHRWTVNLMKRSADWAPTGYRQVRAMEPRLNVRPIASEIAGLIKERTKDPRLLWKKDGSVYIRIGQVIPHDAPNQTVAGRRRRFTKALLEELERNGWIEIGLHTYAQR